jgi:hypothetical protein
MIENFKSDLNSLKPIQLFRKYILGSTCYILDSQQDLELREKVSANFEIEFQDVIVVGSGKLGFSIKPSKRYVGFCDESDIDIAIVSSKLLKKFGKRLICIAKVVLTGQNQTSFLVIYLKAG